jgi:hypothetical protein
MKKHKFNWIDGLVLAVVVLLIAGTCFKFLGNNYTSKRQEQVDFTFDLRIDGVRQFTVDAIQPGDTIYDSSAKVALGTITAVSASPAETTVSYPDGTLRKATLEDRYDVIVTVESQGVRNDGVLQVSTCDIQINRTATYYTKYSIWSAQLVALETT